MLCLFLLIVLSFLIVQSPEQVLMLPLKDKRYSLSLTSWLFYATHFIDMINVLGISNSSIFTLEKIVYRVWLSTYLILSVIQSNPLKYCVAGWLEEFVESFYFIIIVMWCDLVISSRYDVIWSSHHDMITTRL